METFHLSKQTWANVMDLKELLDVNCMQSLTEDLNRKMDDVIPEAKHCSRCRVFVYTRQHPVAGNTLIHILFQQRRWCGMKKDRVPEGKFPF